MQHDVDVWEERRESELIKFVTLLKRVVVLGQKHGRIEIEYTPRTNMALSLRKACGVMSGVLPPALARRWNEEARPDEGDYLACDSQVEYF